MDPISLSKLQIHPEEVNLNTGRIKIVSKVEEDVSHKMAHTQRLASLQMEREPREETFTDLHRVWIPAGVFLAFILLGVFVFTLRKEIVRMDKRIVEVETAQSQLQKDFQRDLALLKENISNDKVPVSEINARLESFTASLKESSASLKELKSDQLNLQKKIESLNMKEVLILETDPTPAVVTPTKPAEKKP